MLESFRAACKDTGLPSCKKLRITPWTSSTNCVWCPKPGVNLPGGDGECRPGGSYGICELATLQQRQIFGVQTRGGCSPLTNCALTNRYPDLKPFILNPIRTPTGKPVTKVPTTLPPTDSFPPSTSNPTIQGPPTSKPSTPTLRPSPPTTKPPGPTARRTNSPSNFPTFQPTERPTSDVPCTSYKTLWLCVGAGCKWSISGKKDQCVDMPPEGAVLACAVYTNPAQCNADRLDAGGCVWKSSSEGGICVRRKILRP